MKEDGLYIQLHRAEYVPFFGVIVIRMIDKHGNNTCIYCRNNTVNNFKNYD